MRGDRKVACPAALLLGEVDLEIERRTAYLEHTLPVSLRRRGVGGLGACRGRDQHDEGKQGRHRLAVARWLRRRAGHVEFPEQWIQRPRSSRAPGGARKRPGAGCGPPARERGRSAAPTSVQSFTRWTLW